MSSALKARLRRCSRYNSPTVIRGSKSVTPVSKSCFGASEEHNNTASKRTSKVLSFTSPNPEIRKSLAAINSKVAKRQHSDDTDDESSLSREHNKYFRRCKDEEGCAVAGMMPSKDVTAGCVTSEGIVVTEVNRKSSAEEIQNIPDLKHANISLHQRIDIKREELRKLKMTKLYRSKNDLGKLENLTSKWKQVCQDAIQELWDLAPDPKPSLTDIVNHFHIDHKLLDYDDEDETFT